MKQSNEKRNNITETIFHVPYDLIMPAAGKATRSGLSYSKLLYPIKTANKSNTGRDKEQDTGKDINIDTDRAGREIDSNNNMDTARPLPIQPEPGQPESVLLDYSLKPFLQDPDCKQIFLVIDPESKEAFSHYENFEKIKLIDGGSSRSESVRNGLKEVKEHLVLIHDGARPFVTSEIIENVKRGLLFAPTSIASIPCRDTIKYKSEMGLIFTFNRNKLYQSQTPQGFRTYALKEAFDWLDQEMQDKEKKIEFSDEAQLMEAFDYNIQLVKGNSTNLKITDPSDFAFLKLLED